jgi:predicted esterase YcpF (UPF0227 family)
LSGLLYLHGFTSAPQSRKAQALKARLIERGRGDAFLCPQLPPSPRQAIELAESLIASVPPPLTLVGSSLGGYYATWLAERHPEAVRGAVLVNPAVVAHLSLQEFVGPQKNLYTGETFDFTADHVAELRALDVPRLARPERYWLLLEQGDELLDWRQAAAKYAGAHQTVLAGGDHSFSRWDDYLDEIIKFAGL